MYKSMLLFFAQDTISGNTFQKAGLSVLAQIPKLVNLFNPYPPGPNSRQNPWLIIESFVQQLQVLICTFRLV